MRVSAPVVVALLLIAGCQTPFDAGVASPSPGDASGDVATGSATPAATANPWGKRTLTVAVVNTASPWRNVTGLVADALAYWERHDAAYGRYEVDYDLRRNASDPDVVVHYAETISPCGAVGDEGGVGFAPRVTAGTPPDPPERVCVRAGFTEASTRHVIKHEFGHLLGIDHGDPPRELMRPDREYLRIPRPDPALLTASFPRETLSVYVDRSDLYARRKVVAGEQLDRAFAYYERDASGSAAPVNIVETDDRSAADVVISFPRHPACDRDRVGSCGRVGTRSDGTPRLRVSITTTHEDTFGWHAGFWMGYVLGAERHADLPAPFRNASVDDRRRWWAEAS